MKMIRFALAAAATLILPQAMAVTINVDRAMALEIERDLACPATRLIG